MNKNPLHSQLSTLVGWLLAVSATMLIAACGGGGTDSSGLTITSPVNSGIAVDPYIVNARFEEVSADGSRVIQNLSSASDIV